MSIGKEVKQVNQQNDRQEDASSSKLPMSRIDVLEDIAPMLRCGCNC
jgi:hypothetical protein